MKKILVLVVIVILSACESNNTNQQIERDTGARIITIECVKSLKICAKSLGKNTFKTAILRYKPDDNESIPEWIIHSRQYRRPHYSGLHWDREYTDFKVSLTGQQFAALVRVSATLECSPEIALRWIIYKTFLDNNR